MSFDMVPRKLVPFKELFSEPLRNGLTRPNSVRGMGVKMVGMGEVFAHARIGCIPMDRVPLSEEEGARFLLRANDLLFARQSLVRDGAGKCCLFLGDREPVTFESHIIRARLDTKRADPRFYQAFFRSRAGRSTIETIVEQVAAAGIRGSDLASLRIPFPPLAEQQAIGEMVASIDAKIELNKGTSETLEAMTRALFKSWFVDFDPVRAKSEGRRPTGMDGDAAGLFPSTLEKPGPVQIPQGWTRAPLGGWVLALSGGTPSKTDTSLWGGDIPWISPKAMKGIHADDSDERVTPQAIGNGTRLAPVGSTLVMVRGMGLHEQVRVSQARREVAFNQDVKALVPRGIQASLLLFALLDAQQDLLEKVESSGHGTGKLPTEILLAHPITMPPVPVQTALAEKLEALNAYIASARAESRTLAELRDTLLPKLISGEIRIKDAEKLASAAL